MDYKQQSNNELFEEVDDAELEDEATSLAENTMHGNLLQAAIITHIVAELIDVFNYSEVWRDKHAPVVLDRLGQRISERVQLA